MGTLLPKLIIAITVLTVLFSLAVWLWQRQPKGQTVVEPLTTQIATQEAKSQEVKLIESPKDNSVITSAKVTISGQSKPNTYINFATASYQYVVKVDAQGKYQKDIELAKGLNLIKVATFTQELQEDKAENLTLFAAQNQDNGQNGLPAGRQVFAGKVIAIFDTTITLSTPSGDKNVRTTESTNINAPTSAKDDKQTPKSVQNSVRVGDFAVAIGKVPTAVNVTDSLDGESLEIIRENKPQNTENLIAAKIASTVNQNLIVAKNIKDAKPIDFILNKDSDISIGDKLGTVKDIAKDKTAFIFYHTDNNKNLVDLIYLLP